MGDAADVAGDKDQLEEPRRVGDGGNIFLTCLRIRFEERGSWSKALADPPTQGAEEHEKLEGVVAAGSNSPVHADSPTARLKKEKSGFLRRLTVPMRSEDESSGSSNSSPSLRKLRSKLCHLAFGHSSETLLLHQSDVASAGFWGRALGGNDVASKNPAVPSSAFTGGVAMTAKPLRPLRAQAARGPGSRGLPAPRAAYYLEFEVVETDPDTTGTLSLGFCFLAGARPQEPLPHTARDLPGSFVLGGELPKAHFGGTEIVSSLEWRPLIHVSQGSRIGMLLEVRDLTGGPRELPILRSSVVQDGLLRTEASVWPTNLAALAEEERTAVEAAANGQRPYGLAEVCGSVRSLRLCTDVTEPPTLR